ncbi:MAG: hypothetical protein KatS3mg045_1486 [Bellilinea sp.]|nr:MAG: hypothetical protein KatS3mg045_1486 [Bellilinea sp.]
MNVKYKLISIILTISFLLPLFYWWNKGVMVGVLLIIGFFLFQIFRKFVLPLVVNEANAYSFRWRWFLVIVSLVTGIWLTLNIPVVKPPVEQTPFLPPLFVRMTYTVSVGVGIGFIVLIATMFLVRKAIFKEPEESRYSSFMFLKYWLPIIFMWGIYLLAFYPGIMTSDSMDQWNQMLTGIYNDHHPAFHTFTNWLVTRIALTPTSVAIAQILFLGMIAAQWLAFLEKIGLSKWLVFAGLVLFSLSPVNGTMVNTLWKDIPFSISVMGVTLFLAKIVFSHGEWIHSWKAKILFGVFIALVLLFRHDGAPLGFGTLVAVFVFYPQKLRHWLITLLICLGIYFGVRGPLYQAVGVQKSTMLRESSLSLYSMALYAKNGSQAEQLIRSFKLLSSNWECNLGSKINPEWRITDLDYTIPSIRMISNFISRVPNVLIYFYRCARSMEWIVWDPYGEVRDASNMTEFIVPNPFGIRPESKIPWLRDFIANLVIETSVNPNINWFTWRPAFFLYIHIFVILVLAIRNRSLKFFLISLPILLQSITFSLIFANPNFRYHYAVYLVSMITWPLLFSPPRLDKYIIKL